MGERVVRRGVGERLPAKVTWGRVVHLQLRLVCAGVRLRERVLIRPT